MNVVDKLYALLDDHGWAQHYRCGWVNGDPPPEGMCGKEWHERESVKEMVSLVIRHTQENR